MNYRVSPTFFIATAPYAYFGVGGGIGPSGISRYYFGKIQVCKDET